LYSFANSVELLKEVKSTSEAVQAKRKEIASGSSYTAKPRPRNSLRIDAKFPSTVEETTLA